MHARAATRHLVTIFLGATLGLAACSGDRYIVVGSARAPSTSGWVVIEDASTSSAEVTVHLEHLPRAKQLDPAMRVYVVWFEPTSLGGAPNRAGTLKYYPDDRIGELKAKAPFGKFVVKVTAEANDKPAMPSDFVVASQEITLED
ncbi:MAG TPA: hypothetical protein VJR89_08420 [Polyangiales bacterium]|nr:hypothetical protein [Polyangiales bacterium]